MMRRYGLAAALFGVAIGGHASAQDGPATPTAKFVGVNERGQRFEQAFVQTGCRKLSSSLGVCLEGSQFKLEDSIPDGRNRLELYSVDDARRAALRSLHFDLRAPLEIAPDDLEVLVERHLFAEAPRGPRKRLEIVKESRRDTGLLGQQTAIVEKANSGVALLQFNIFRNQWDLGFAETVIDLPEGTNTSADLEAAEAFHTEFLDITRISVSVGPGYE